MANPRQRRKSRSSKYSGATKSAKRAQNKRIHRGPSVMGPEVMREQWDKSLTPRQNYAKLGLAPSLVPQSGGLDRKDPYANVKRAEPQAAAPKARKGMARIVRNEQGEVVDIIEEDGEKDEDATPWGSAMNADEDEPANLVMLPPRLHAKDGESVEALAKLAEEDRPVSRFSSSNEFAWLAELVHKHGDDIDAMVRDRHLNIWQKTAGEIRRALRKAGGIDNVRIE
ncbi:Nucleolar protein 16 [Malassezia japonica]|uniref:Nucleolar protein 16 n=1 Tax=Malassezia japonica TaxID=223818 RepID=A0AAF0F5P7_9BASI|nr:Nucleolar protein 16 [Malassezia japonica]WFD38932.1 Nucleolar protein 16 [Malassezia japonica]